MKIGYKTCIIAIISTLLVIVLTYFVFHIAYFGYVNTNQVQQLNRSFEVIDAILDKEKVNLEGTLIDWAHWDDSYEFINTSNHNYISSNLEYNTLEALNLKMMIFSDTSGDVIYSINADLPGKLAKQLTEKLLSNKGTLTTPLFITNTEDVKSGILIAGDIPFLIGIAPITTSDEQAPTNGFLLMVREIDENLLTYIQHISNVTAKFELYTINGFRAYEKSTPLDHVIRSHQYMPFLEENRIIRDINGESTVLLSVSNQQGNHENTFYHFKLFINGFLFIIILVGLINLLIIHKYILRRLLKLNNFMNKVAVTQDTSLSVSMSGSDEFYQLAASTNKMLSQLNTAYKRLSLMGERFRIIMEATNDGYLDLNILEKDLYISYKWKKMIGYEGISGKELFKNYISKIHPKCYARLNELFRLILAGKSDYIHCEYRVIQPSGSVLWVLQRGKIVEKDEKGNPVRLVSTVTNITERKNHEEEILFLSYSDKLTGLKNRAYMEEKFAKLDQCIDAHYFIIMGDLNGLKLANDALGHKEGDHLLRTMSNILLASCASDDIVSRWGGDEFIILVYNKNTSYITHLIHKIKMLCNKPSTLPFKVSMALGYAEKTKELSDTAAVMSLSENRMYRNKLMENKSARSSIISSLSRTLHEKHTETEQHTLRIRALSLKLGKRLELSQDKLDELELLALLHDIGKIGIPDYILLKPDKLTADEWHIMKTHTEIGYRIALSTPELSHIANEILAHHERFDGTGYPTGLKAEEIPILSRIINIVDSFDVMTHKRVYKSAYTLDYAKQELKRCSGSQFDPLIAHEFIALLEDNTTIE